MSQNTILRVSDHKFIYNGSSMAPTFRPGQGLLVRPGAHALRPGDVVIYRQAGRFVVHRLLSSDASGYRLRGDNNGLPDLAPIPPVQVIGRVEQVTWGGKTRRVLNGYTGLWKARLGWAIRRLDHAFRVVLGWPYRLLKSSRLISRIWKPLIQTVHLQTENGPLIKYLYRGRKIATWEPLPGRFLCRKPFDLVIYPPPLSPLQFVQPEPSSSTCKPGSAS